MKLTLKIIIGLVLALLLVGIGAAAALFLSAAKPEHPVSFAQVTVQDLQDRPLDVGIWYPTDGRLWPRLIGLSAQMVASNATIVGALRALGFRRSSILAAFLLEALALSLIGGAVGLALAVPMQLVQISTANWQTLSEIAFRFTLTPGIVALSLGFALAMGFAGGFLPAVKAARLGIVQALRTA